MCVTRWSGRLANQFQLSVCVRWRIAVAMLEKLLRCPWTVRKQLLHALLMQARDVCPCTVQSPLEFVTLTKKLVPLGKKVLVFLAEAVPIVFDPGTIRLSQLSQ